MDRWVRSLFGSTSMLLLIVMQLSAFGCNSKATQSANAAPHFANGGRDTVVLLREAAQANYSHNILLQKQILERVISIQPPSHDTADAERLLGRMCWRYEKQYDQAYVHFRKAMATKDVAAATWLDVADMELSRRHYEDAGNAADAALAAASLPLEKLGAQIKAAQAVIDEALAERLAGGAAQTKEINGTFTSLRRLMEAQPGMEIISRLFLQASLLVGDGPAALAAWRAYFRADGGAPAPGDITEAGDSLSRLLPAWREPGNAEARLALICALGDSRLFREAALVALDPRPAFATQLQQNPRVRELVAYARAYDELSARVDEYYRQTLLGKGKPKVLDAIMKETAEKLWPQLAFPSPKLPDISPDRFREEMEKRFGAVVTLGTSAGYYDLHMGHRIVNEERVIKQYARQAKIHFIVLDSMVSNGFQSWAWDNGSQHGGSATSEAIVRVRQAYSGNALYAWYSVVDEAVRAKNEEESQKAAEIDRQTAEKNPTAYMGGLKKRIYQQGLQRLLDRLKASGLTGKQLQIAFLSEYDRAIQESTIFAHEGRHAIDQQPGPFNIASSKSEELEFRAKLSQVAFAPEPRLILGSIIDANIGDSTPHGQANLRIMKELVPWMSKHSKEIQGFDGLSPILPQLDKLTDDQLRAAFRSMDPLAR
ncbi:MAG: hypothetical protein JXA73_12690 [Acidobacteria bacterium]|nr:hypothetical protein [Acidobacteriota bacterium]